MISPYVYVGLADTKDMVIPKRSRIDIIIDYVCEQYKIKKESLFLDRRFREIVVPRQIVFYLLKKYTFITLNEIGRMFRGKDHTTIMYGIRKVEDYKSCDEKFRAILSAIEYNIEKVNEFQPTIMLPSDHESKAQDKIEAQKYIKLSNTINKKK